MAVQLGFHVDMSSCIGCKTCVIACKDKNDLPVGQLFRRVVEVEGGTWQVEGATVIPHLYAYWISISCNHCTNPACVRNCPTGAMQKRAKDGVVVINQEACIGCQYCAWSCPYGAPQYNPATGKSSKCDLCVDLLERGEEPACVSSCPMRAIHVGPVAELEALFGGTAVAHGLPNPALTQPNTRFTPHRDARPEAVRERGITIDGTF
ncbi:MAG: DMSO/selenate family reductase complex B subunit [Mycobacterium leprae]